MLGDTSEGVVTKQADINDAERRSSTWATMPATSKGPALSANEEQSRRIRAWELHGLAPPTQVGAQRRDVYGNVLKVEQRVHSHSLPQATTAETHHLWLTK